MSTQILQFVKNVNVLTLVSHWHELISVDYTLDAVNMWMRVSLRRKHSFACGLCGLSVARHFNLSKLINFMFLVSCVFPE